MTTAEKQLELRDKIIAGLDIAYNRLLKYKRLKNTELVIIKDNKIQRIKP